MSGETGIGEMTAEQTKKAETIYRKLNVILLEIKKNLDIWKQSILIIQN